MRLDSAANKRHPLSERGDDLYETPEVATAALLSIEKLPPTIWEPACGRGAIAKPLMAAGLNVWSSDLVDYGFGIPGIDFLFERQCWSGAIITNPPYKIADEFVRHALSLCERVIMLLRLAFYESERRSDILENAGLARIHCFARRLPMMHRDGWEGKKANSGMAFAWFVWDRNHSGATTIHRVRW